MTIARFSRSKAVPLDIVGSSTFGRSSEISGARTYNMFESDGFLVNYAGYLSLVKDLGENGRGIYTSNRSNRIIAVFGNKVYSIFVLYNVNLNQPYQFTAELVGNLDTSSTDVFIAENNNGQIAISDQANIYIYDPTTSPLLQKVNTGMDYFIPGFIDFHDGRFMCAATGTNTWRLSADNDGTVWRNDAQHVGTLQTKPDNCVAVVRMPSGGNTVFVFGQNVVESWFDYGGQLFPYQRNTSFNVDYGCVNASTIARSDTFICWLGQNEKSGPVIMYSSGGPPEKISTDGIDFELSNLVHPNSAEAFMYRQDGHIFYHINFILDNKSFYYDFNTGKFYNAVDEDMNYFIAKEVAYFQNQYYFVSRNNGNFYAFDTIYSTFDGALAPRIRVCTPIRDIDQSNTVKTDLGFTIAQGNDNPIQTKQNGEQVYTYPRVDMSFSTDGGQSFTSYVPYELNSLGNRPNMLRWWQLGMSNYFAPQFRFYGLNGFYVTDGVVNCVGLI